MMSFDVAKQGSVCVRSQQNYRLLAQYYLELAKGSTDPDVANQLRAIAADYFDLAEAVGGNASHVAQQQQQIQPDEDAK